MTVDDVDEGFADVWRAAPDLAKHEALWSDDIVLVAPMMGTLRGKQACRESFQRLFALVHRVGHGPKRCSSSSR
jgi:ketosteroid isomerase-like protein